MEYKYMRFGHEDLFIFGKFPILCYTSVVLSQFLRNLFTIISGKLTITNYLKLNDFDYPNPCTVIIKIT